MLGGILTQFAGWRAIFLVNPPVIVILVLAIMRLLPHDAHSDNSNKPRLDITGAVLVTASVASLIYGLTQGQQRGFGRPLTLASLALAVLLAVAFVVTERRVAVAAARTRAASGAAALSARPAQAAALAAGYRLSYLVAAIVVALALLLALVLLRPRPGS